MGIWTNRRIRRTGAGRKGREREREGRGDGGRRPRVEGGRGAHACRFCVYTTVCVWPPQTPTWHSPVLTAVSALSAFYTPCRRMALASITILILAVDFFLEGRASESLRNTVVISVSIATFRPLSNFFTEIQSKHGKLTGAHRYQSKVFKENEKSPK